MFTELIKGENIQQPNITPEKMVKAVAQSAMVLEGA